MPGAAKRPFGGIWNKGSRSGLGMFADGGEMHAECAVPNGAKAFLSYFLCPTKSREKVAARTCKKYQSVSLSGSSRFCKPRISAQNYTFPLTKLNPFAASRLLRRPRRHFLLLPQQLLSLRDFSCGFAAFSGGTAAFVTFLWKVRPCRDGTLRVLFPPPAAAHSPAA